MAKAKGQATVSFFKKPKKKNPGVHAKSKSSKNKNSQSQIVYNRCCHI
jgi:hypothetical protein